MFTFCPLASGSKGNCHYLGTPDIKILFDCGLSGKATKERLASIGVEIDEIDAIVISHEHIDHILGLRVLAFRLGIPVYANAETTRAIRDYFPGRDATYRIFYTGETFSIGSVDIHPFTIQHDAADPVAFSVEAAGWKLGLCTDLGVSTTLVESCLQGCDFLVLEANHEPELVHACARPMTYKQRVLGRSGHLSNDECAQLLTRIAHPKLQHVHLAHLSEECNIPERAQEKIKTTLESMNLSTTVSIALQHQVSRAIETDRTTEPSTVKSMV